MVNQNWIKIAKKLIHTDDFSGVIDFLNDYLKINDQDHYAYSYLGLAYFLNDNQHQAQEIWYSLILEFNKGVEIIVDIIENEAIHRLQKKQFRLSQNLWELALELKLSLDSYIGLAESLTQQGLFDEALDCWQQVLNLDPNYTEAYRQQGLIYQAIQDYTKAIVVYERLSEISPNEIESLYQLALCYVETNNRKKSIKVIKSCLKLDPNCSHIWGELGYVLLIDQHPQKGIMALKKMINHNFELFQHYCDWSAQLSTIPHQDNVQVQTNVSLIQSLHFNRPTEKIYSYLSDTFFAAGNYSLGKYFYQKSPERNHESRFEADIPFDYNTLSKGDIKNNPTKIPQGFYLTTRAWVEQQGLSKIKYYAIFPESIVKLIPPNTVEKYTHCSFWFGEAILLPGSFVVEINQGRFWLNRAETRSAIITPDNKILGDLSPESPALSPNHPDKHPSKNTIFSRDYLPQIDYIDKSVVVLSGLLNNIYFHWLFDILPRIHLLKSSSIDWDGIDYFIINQGCSFQQETLTILGVDKNKIIDPSTLDNVHIQAERLIVPSFPGSIAWMPKWACDFLQDSFISPEYLLRKPTKRIYIKRNQSTSRRLINEDEIIDFLSGFGFEAINLELLSVSQQANLLAQTAIVISPHGSGLSNIVFCQPNITVIEIFSPFYVYPCYWLVSNLVGLKYFYVVGEVIGSYHFHKLLYPDSRGEDIYLDCQKLMQIMQIAGIITSGF